MRRLHKALLGLLLASYGISGAAVAQARHRSAPASVIDKRAKLTAATYLDNRDYSWYVKNIPFIDTPDHVIDDTFYYRFDLMTKHMVYGSVAHGYAVTEFIDKPAWSGSYGAIACPLGLQFADLRWLRDQRVARDYAQYWLHVPGAQPRRYTNWFGATMWGLYEAWGDKTFVLSMLPDMKAQYAGWEAERWDKRYNMFVWDGMQDGMETNINSRQTDKKYYGDDGVRPTFNSYMFADARAIAAASRLAGDEATAIDFDRRAAALKAGVQKLLWDPKRRFFFHMFANDEKLADGQAGSIKAGTLTYQSGAHAGDSHGRELIGLVPWQFNLPDAGYEDAWSAIKDPQRFKAPFGPTTTERHDPLFMITDYCCTWSGNSWPFATSQTLEAMANLLNNYHQSVVSSSDYFELLHRFSATQRKDGQPFVAEAANPDTGAWQITPNHSEHYFHSSYVDLIVTGLAGLRPSSDDRLIVNPLIPQHWNWFALQDAPYHGHLITIIWDRYGTRYHRGKGLTVFVDGKLATRVDNLRKIDIPLLRKPSASVDRSVNFAVNPEGKGYPSVKASFTSAAAPISAVNDGLHWYAKQPPNRWTTQGDKSDSAAIEIDFGSIKTLQRLSLYLIDDGAKEAVRVPAAIRAEYWAESVGWMAVPMKEPVGRLEGHRPTQIVFSSLTRTRKIRVIFQRQAGASIGVSELEAWGPAPSLAIGERKRNRSNTILN